MLMAVQQHLLKMLKEIDVLCRENGITYYLGGGCLVGAMRNSGFLPWDDDVDIHMTREDAMRFMELCDKFPPDRELLCYELDHMAPTVLWRYVDTSKTTYMRSTFYFDAPGGQFVDIFVLDPVSADDETIEDVERKRQMFNEFSMTQYFIDTRYDDDFLREYMSLKKREKKVGFEAIHKEFEDELYTGEEENATYYLVRTPSTEVRPFPKSMWGKPRFVDFEDTLMPVPERAEELLSYAYGDRWVDIPVHLERGSHVFLSDEVLPYKVYGDEINNYIDKKELYEFHEKRKNRIVSELTDRNYVNPIQWLWLTDIEIKKIEARIKRENINIMELAENLNIKKIEHIFSDYYITQFSKFKFYDLYFDMKDDWLYAAMLPLLYKGDYNKVKNVLEYRCSENERELSQKLSELKEFADDLTLITDYIFVYKRYSDARRIVDNYLPIWNWQITLIRSDILLMFSERRSKKLIRSKLEEYLKLYPRDGELLKYYADIEVSAGNRFTAEKLYKKAYGTVKNGLVKSQIISELEVMS